MRKFGYSNFCIGVDSRVQLIELLNRYKGILNTEKIDYLQSLIDLEFSVVRDNISEEDRKALSELDLYKRITIYNIYSRTLKLLQDYVPEIDIVNNKDGYEGITTSVSIGNSTIKLFDYSYEDSIDSKTSSAGTINIFQSIENRELIEDELGRIEGVLRILNSQENPHIGEPGVFGGPAAHWELLHSSEIIKYETLLKQLEKKRVLSDDDKREIELSNKYHDLLFSDYGLSNDMMSEENTPRKDCTMLHKTLYKRRGIITIKNNIKYM